MSLLKWAVVRPTYIRVARERHSDGNHLLHCLVQLSGKSSIKDQRFFDLPHPNNSEIQFHPNIQLAKDSNAVKNYISKEGDFCEWGEYKIQGSSRASKDDVYHNALRSANAHEALEIIKERDPKTFVTQHHNIKANLERIYTPLRSQKVSKWKPDDFVITDDMEQWLGDSFLRLNDDSTAFPVQNNDVDRPKALILEGPSRTGKSCWAKCLGDHNLLPGHLDFNSKTFSNDAVYDIIDDITPQCLKLKHWRSLIQSIKGWALLRSTMQFVTACNKYFTSPSYLILRVYSSLSDALFIMAALRQPRAFEI